MALLPSDDWIIETTASVDDLVRGLESVIGKGDPDRDSESAAFRGRIGPDGFDLRSNLGTPSESNMAPRMSGEFEPREDGTVVIVRLRMTGGVKTLLTIWFAGLAAVVIACLYALVTQGRWLFLTAALTMGLTAEETIRRQALKGAKRSRQQLEETISKIEEAACPHT